MEKEKVVCVRVCGEGSCRGEDGSEERKTAAYAHPNWREREIGSVCVCVCNERVIDDECLCVFVTCV